MFSILNESSCRQRKSNQRLLGEDVDHDKSSIITTRVSGDGAWQNGVVTIIASGKCVDMKY